MADKFVIEDTQEDILQAFEVFDRDGKGFISNPELRHVLTCLGEKLDEEDVEDMLLQADQGDGNFIIFIFLFLFFFLFYFFFIFHFLFLFLLFYFIFYFIFDFLLK